jgi:formylglycine-generating enzyme required for sulfatase activity
MTPKKLFISYPSESWNFAQRIAENLARRVEQSIFIDYRSIDQADFAESILNHLRDSDAVVLIVTEYTFADIHRDRDWVRLEIRTALENQIPLILVRENGMLPPKELPEDVHDVHRSQGVPFYREFFDPGMDMLTDFLIRIAVATARVANATPPALIIQPTPSPTVPVQAEPQRAILGQGSIDEAIDLIEAGDFEKALVILGTLSEYGTLRPVAVQLVSDLIAQAQTKRESAARRREAELDYETIVAMARRKITEATARAAFAEWCRTYPDLLAELDRADLQQKWGAAGPDISLGRTFSSRRNADWQPVITTFADCPIPDMPFCLVPVGSFQMGSNDGHYDDEKPVHEQPITQPYWIAQYPVTNAQWRLAVQAGAVREPYDTKWYTDAAMQDCPVVAVDWFMARDFVAWMGCRLPSEMEWEYAARGVESWRYPWGNEWEGGKRAIWKETSGGKPNSVSSKPEGASWVGGMHLIGNVWEWTNSLYSAYPYQAGDGRERDTGDSTDVQRVLRGGSWNLNTSAVLRAACRYNGTPDFRDVGWGFRIARSS